MKLYFANKAALSFLFGTVLLSANLIARRESLQVRALFHFCQFPKFEVSGGRVSNAEVGKSCY